METMPKPRSDETRDAFLDRGMEDPEAKRDFPDWRERFAFLADQWDERATKADSFVPPKGVREAAARGLELRRKFGRGGTGVGIARARDLSNGSGVSRETLGRMRDFFNRHEENKDTPPEEGNGKIAWLLWGGDAGRAWAESELGRLEKGASAPRTLYVSRPLQNAAEFVRWAKAQGFSRTLAPEDLHVTVCYSKAALDWFQIPPADEMLRVPPGGARVVQELGDEGAVVLMFATKELSDRHDVLMSYGASHGHPDYNPHVTITYQGEGVDLSAVKPYEGELIFGPERFREVKEDWLGDVREKGYASGGVIPPALPKVIGEMVTDCIVPLQRVRQRPCAPDIVKASTEHRVIYGWFSVIEKDGEIVYDRDGDAISEETLTKAVYRFNAGDRAAKIMHRGKVVGRVIESILLTRDIQKAMGIHLDRAGWFGAVQFDDQETFDLVKSIGFNGFSWGGKALRRKL